MCREPPPGHMFMGSLAEIDPRKVAEVVRHLRSPIKNNASATHFFALSAKPIAWFRWKRARLSRFLCLNSPELLFYLLELWLGSGLGIRLGLGLGIGLGLEKWKNNLAELRHKYRLVFSGLNPTCQVSSKSIQVSESYWRKWPSRSLQ